MHLDRVEQNASAVEFTHQARDCTTGARNTPRNTTVSDLHIAFGQRIQLLRCFGYAGGVGDLDVNQVSSHSSLQVVGGIGGDDAATVDHHNAIAERIGLIEVVRREANGGAMFAAQIGDVLPQIGPCLRV